MNAKRKFTSEKSDSHKDNTKFTVKNFGPIAQGEVDLRPLTVFAGPSNTGKSWMATLLYVIGQYLNGNYIGNFRFLRRQSSLLEKPFIFPENPNTWLKSIQDNAAMPLTDGDRDFIENAWNSWSSGLEEDLIRCFGLSEIRHLVREKSKLPATISIHYNDAAQPLVLHRGLNISQTGKLSLDVTAAHKWCLPHTKDSQKKKVFLEELKEFARNKDTEEEEMLLFHQRLLLPYLYLENESKNFYLPADRGGVMHAHHVVVSALIQNASRAALGRDSSLPALSGVLTDFLQNLIEVADGSHRRRYMHLSHIRRDRKPSNNRADRLEDSVLRGKVALERGEVNYPRFSYSPNGWSRSLSLVNVSSMVSELAPVALYLRHHVRKGDLLILEEPEAHLHPEIQVAFVREIASWIRQGIRVLLTTHSEWVLEEISNLVAAGNAGDSEALSSEDVGFWLFEPRKDTSSGTRIREIPWDADQGGYTSDFDRVAQALHNKWADIMNGSHDD
ncbi:MAG: AAA family ATPase [Cellvibrionales bacterium]|nr:AAA family ATPase [Cellvibrionales bacterium]